MGKSLCEGYEFAGARLRNLVLHDLQGLGSLTKIWRSLSDTWDKLISRRTRINTVMYLRKGKCPAFNCCSMYLINSRIMAITIQKRYSLVVFGPTYPCQKLRDIGHHLTFASWHLVQFRHLTLTFQLSPWRAPHLVRRAGGCHC
jgi:hypothetical protein